MRERLQPYRGANALNYLCLLATQLLGKTHLRDLPALLTGFDSVTKTLPGNVVTAIQNLRIDGHAPWSQRELRLMVDQYNEAHRRLDQKRRQATKPKMWDDDPEPSDSGAGAPSVSKPTVDEEEGSSKRFEVDAQLNVRPVWTSIMPDDVREALASLTSPLLVRKRALRKRHDPTFLVRVVDERQHFQTAIAPLGYQPPEPPIMDMARHGRAPGLVRWSDLVATADRFDTMDEAAGRQRPGERSWYRRLHTATGEKTAVLTQATPAGLAECDALELIGVKHLVGLPGAGKTTLLYLLAAWASERDYRVCFLFPSIEVATGFIERVALYEVRSALLFGQSDKARSKHVASFAAALSQDNRGYAVTRTAAPFFATNCSLAAFAGDEEAAFPHAHPPCQQVQQTPAGAKASNGPVAHQCALASVCGRQEAERALVDASVWAGHILSTDRDISPLFSDVQLKHFEYLARTFDLVVVDECDGAQANMDGRGTPLMKLSGDSDSVWNRLLLDLHAPAAQGRNAFIGGTSIATIMAMSGRFGQAAERLTAGIVKSPKEFRDEYSRKLLTGLSLIADMFPPSRSAAALEDEEEVQAHLDARQGLERIWDYAAKRVAFREGGEALRHLNELQREDDGEASGDQPPAAASSGMGDSEVSKIAAQMHVTPDAVRAYAAGRLAVQGEAAGRVNLPTVRPFLIASPGQALVLAIRSVSATKLWPKNAVVAAVPNWSDDAVYFRFNHNQHENLPIRDSAEARSAILCASCGYGEELESIAGSTLTLTEALALPGQALKRLTPDLGAFYGRIGIASSLPPDQLQALETVLLSLHDTPYHSGQEHELLPANKLKDHHLLFAQWMGLIQVAPTGVWDVPALYLDLLLARP